jgi:CPA2 family monovalent cation:H+ antiporter-2
MASEGFSHYREFLILLAVAGVIVPFLLRLGINTVLGFLLVGVVLGPDILGRLAASFPALNAFQFEDIGSLSGLGELGVVFLLFLIGLELSFERLMTMRRLVFGLGGLQVVVTTVVLAGIAGVLGYPKEESIILGAALSLSSTAIVIQLLSDQKRLGSQAGRLSFAILLFQDLAVVPILLLVSALGGNNEEGNLLGDIAIAFGQAAIAIALIIGLGRYLLRPLLRVVAGTKSSELFMATTLLIAVGTGVAATFAGLSMALGAFIAGLVLAETEYRRAIESVIEPFKGLLLGTFFLLVGLGIDLEQLILNPVVIIGLSISLIALKAALTYALSRAFAISHGPSLEASLLLGSGGEFAFIVLGAALALNIVTPAMHSEAFLVVSITMALIPVMARLGQMLRRATPPRMDDAAAIVAPPADHEARVIVAGFGRVGHLLGTMLAEHKISYIAIDSDAEVVARQRKNGYPIYFGDAANPVFLRRCGLDTAKTLAVTMDSPARVDDVTKVARAARDDLKIVARARDEKHAMELYALGVTEAVPETIEASLQLGEAVLVETGVPMGLAIASVHERRDGFRRLLNRPNRREMVERLRSRRKL